MRMRILLILILFSISVSLLANENERLFQEGNTHYQNGSYQQALESYATILATGYVSGELYFNIGNCYYKLENLGKTILYYEKAKLLMQGDQDLDANLALANLNVIDKITPLPKFILFRWIDSLFQLMPQQVLIWIIGIIYCFCIGWFIVWILTRNISLRKVGLRIAITTGIITSILFLLLIGKHQAVRNRKEAIIMVSRVDVMSAPNPDVSVEVFTLHEGTKVRIDQASGEWIEIVLADGKVGWIERETVEQI